MTLDDHTPIADGASAASDWFDFELPNRAYIGRVEIDGEAGYAIRDSEGTVLAVLAERDIAFAVARQHDLDPVSMH